MRRHRKKNKDRAEVYVGRIYFKILVSHPMMVFRRPVVLVTWK